MKFENRSDTEASLLDPDMKIIKEIPEVCVIIETSFDFLF